MKIVFFGTSDFAVASLSALIEKGHKVAAAVTQPDKKSGRHLIVVPSPVKKFARENNIFVYQPTNLITPQSRDTLAGFDADLFVVVAYGTILPRQILQIPKKFCINAHGSLLPKYRGAAPMNWALANGEKETGVTIIKMTEEMDAGDIILKKQMLVEADDDARTLSQKLAKLGAVLLVEAIDLVDKGDYKLEKQQGQVSLAPKLKKQDGLIDWNKSAIQINNQVKGMFPWPSAYNYYQSKLFKIFKAKTIEGIEDEYQPGQVAAIEKDGILVKTGQGHLLILSCQLAGGKAMDAASFVTGHKIQVGDKLS